MWKYHWHPVWHGLCVFSSPNILVWNFALIQKRLGNSTVGTYQPSMHNHYSIFINIFSLLSLPLSHCLEFFTRAFLDQGSCRCWLVSRELSCEQGFPDHSVGKESACNAGDPSSIPGSERPAGEGNGYPLRCSWASLVAQLVKNPPAMRETWVRSLGWEDPPEKGKATHSSVLAWRIPWTL